MGIGIFTVGGGTGAIADLLVRGFTGRRPIANKYTLDLEIYQGIAIVKAKAFLNVWAKIS